MLRWSDANTLTYHEVPSRNSSPTDGSELVDMVKGGHITGKGWSHN